MNKTKKVKKKFDPSTAKAGDVVLVLTKKECDVLKELITKKNVLNDMMEHVVEIQTEVSLRINEKLWTKHFPAVDIAELRDRGLGLNWNVNSPKIKVVPISGRRDSHD